MQNWVEFWNEQNFPFGCHFMLHIIISVGNYFAAFKYEFISISLNGWFWHYNYYILNVIKWISINNRLVEIERWRISKFNINGDFLLLWWRNLWFFEILRITDKDDRRIKVLRFSQCHGYTKKKMLKYTMWELLNS